MTTARIALGAPKEDGGRGLLMEVVTDSLEERDRFHGAIIEVLVNQMGNTEELQIFRHNTTTLLCVLQHRKPNGLFRSQKITEWARNTGWNVEVRDMSARERAARLTDVRQWQAELGITASSTFGVDVI